MLFCGECFISVVCLLPIILRRDNCTFIDYLKRLANERFEFTAFNLIQILRMLTLKQLSSRPSENSKLKFYNGIFPNIVIRWRSHISTQFLSKTTRSYDLCHGVQNPFHMRPMTSIFSTGQMRDGSGFYSRQMPHYVELNRGQMPRGLPGGGGGDDRAWN